MTSAFIIVGRDVALWHREFVPLKFFNIVWLAQEDQSLVITLRNGLHFIAKRQAFSITLCLLCAVWVALSVLTTLPLVTVLMAWLALIGVLAVKQKLKGINSD